MFHRLFFYRSLNRSIMQIIWSFVLSFLCFTRNGVEKEFLAALDNMYLV